jgi:hypothetical protein
MRYPGSCFRLLTLSTAIVFTATCTSTKQVVPQQLTREFGQEDSEITSYTTVDGRQHPFEGGGRVVGDELELHRRNLDGSVSPASVFRLPLRQVSLVEVRYKDTAKSVGFIILIIIVVAGVIIGVALLEADASPTETARLP